MADIGLYSLRFALVVTLLGIGVGLYAGLTRRDDWTRVAERTVYVVFGFLSLAMVALFYALATIAGGAMLDLYRNETFHLFGELDFFQYNFLLIFQKNWEFFHSLQN